MSSCYHHSSCSCLYSWCCGLLSSQTIRWRWIQGRSLSSCPAKPELTCQRASQPSGRTVTKWSSTCIRLTTLKSNIRVTEAEPRWRETRWDLETSVWLWNTPQTWTETFSPALPTIVRRTSWWRNECCSRSKVSTAQLSSIKDDYIEPKPPFMIL